MQAEEQLAAQAMTSEEVKKRQDAMARNSALLFYHEQKAKRLKKIKSKAYHRHLKKQTAKAKAALGTNDLDDPDTLAVQHLLYLLDTLCAQCGRLGLRFLNALGSESRDLCLCANRI